MSFLREGRPSVRNQFHDRDPQTASPPFNVPDLPVPTLGRCAIEGKAAPRSGVPRLAVAWRRFALPVRHPRPHHRGRSMRAIRAIMTIPARPSGDQQIRLLVQVIVNKLTICCLSPQSCGTAGATPHGNPPDGAAIAARQRAEDAIPPSRWHIGCIHCSDGFLRPLAEAGLSGRTFREGQGHAGR